MLILYQNLAIFYTKIERRLLHTTPYVTKQKMLYFACWFDTNMKDLPETSEMGVASPESLEK